MSTEWKNIVYWAKLSIIILFILGIVKFINYNNASTTTSNYSSENYIITNDSGIYIDTNNITKEVEQDYEELRDEWTIYSDTYLYSSKSLNSDIITSIPAWTEVYYNYNDSDKKFIFVEIIGTKEKWFIPSSADIRIGTTYKWWVDTIDVIQIEPRYFWWYSCKTFNCSGHQAWYDWAERKWIDNVDDCGGNSQSFIEWCWAYVEENY